MKPIKIFGDNIEPGALEQFYNVMKLDNVVGGALMPDAHFGYVLPIGGVVAVKDAIYPAFIGYDIGCGVLAYKTLFHKKELRDKENKIYESIYRSIPCGEGLFRKQIVDWDYRDIPHTKFIDKVMHKGVSQIGTLGGGNHFIEIAYDEAENIWIVIHSGSRGVGHKTATEYMLIAKHRQNIDTTPFEKEFDNIEGNKVLKAKNLEKYEEYKGDYINSELRKISKGNNEGTYSLDINSREGENYIKDMNFCLQFALQNRLAMLKLVYKDLCHYVGEKVKPSSLDISQVINRNHNHAELKDGLWIHRKGATHAEKGMLGVIPGNMRDGSYIVEGLGNPDSLFSSSHGGGRAMSRSMVKNNVTMSQFKKSMTGITANITEGTLDECPMAYKDIFEVMELQKDLVNIKHHLKPIINIKG